MILFFQVIKIYLIGKKDSQPLLARVRFNRYGIQKRDNITKPLVIDTVKNDPNKNYEYVSLVEEIFNFSGNYKYYSGHQ